MSTSPRLRSKTLSSRNYSHHFNTILSEIKTLSQEFDSLSASIPTIIREELQLRSDKKCIAIYGLPEDSNAVDKVNQVLSLASLTTSDYTILHRLGKPRLDGSSRPLKVKIHTAIPRLIDLSTAMKADPLMSTFHVRKFERSEQRRAGFLARQERRRQDAMPTVLPAEPEPEPPAATSMETEENPEAESTLPVEVPRSDVDSESNVDQQTVWTWQHDLAVQNFLKYHDGDRVYDMYIVFRTYHPIDQKLISDHYFQRFRFRLHYEPSSP